MSKKGASVEPFGGIELVERAVSVLVSLPLSVWCIYLLGVIPFGLISLYFFTDMSLSPYAEQGLVVDSFIVALSALWWRACQARFGAALLAAWTPLALASWSTREWILVALRQGTVFAVFLFLSPIAAILVLPTGWLLSLFQEAVLFGGIPSNSVQSLGRRSFAMMNVWQRQNHVALLIVTGFAFLVLLNVYSFVLFLPFVLRLFTGIETAVTQSPLLVLNTTVLLVVCYLTYFISSPLTRAIYAVRHYHGHSLKTGKDLRDRLPSFTSGADLAKPLILTLFMAWGAFATATPQLAAQEIDSPSTTGISQEASTLELNAAIQEVIQRPDFAWRLPMEDEVASVPSKLSIWIRQIGRWVGHFFQWLFDAMRPEPRDRGESGWFEGWLGARPLLNFLLVVAAIVLATLLFRLLIRSRRKPAPIPAHVVVPVQPDVDDMETLASDLPEDEWMRLAQDFAASGDHTRALRAYYLACLAHLHEADFLRISNSKSNAAYIREVKRRAHRSPELVHEFRNLVHCFDKAWYGEYPVAQHDLERSASSVGNIRHLS